MALLIDTSVLITLEREGKPPAGLRERFGDQPVSLASITASELLHGVHRADSAVRRGKRERFVEALLSSVPILPFDLEVVRIHARLWADLKSRGITVGAHDLIIAATALEHDLLLVTGNPRDFGKIEALRWERG